MIKDMINNSFSDDEKDEVLNLYEKYQLAKNKDISIFGKSFYTPNIWKWFEKNLSNDLVKITSYGVFDDCERRMISFNNKYDEAFPINLLQITNESKFVTLRHKDYLGSLLSLGIERNKLGDLLVCDNVCYVPVSEDIADFLLYNISKINKVSCKVEIIDYYSNLPKLKLKEEVILVSSLRLDSIVSKICNVSRNKAQMIIDQGMVLVDYVRIRDKSFELKGDERITVRGTGKFILGEQIGNSKSGKIKIIIKKYT